MASSPQNGPFYGNDSFPIVLKGLEFIVKLYPYEPCHSLDHLLVK